MDVVFYGFLIKKYKSCYWTCTRKWYSIFSCLRLFFSLPFLSKLICSSGNVFQYITKRVAFSPMPHTNESHKRNIVTRKSLSHKSYWECEILFIFALPWLFCFVFYINFFVQNLLFFIINLLGSTLYLVLTIYYNSIHGTL